MSYLYNPTTNLFYLETAVITPEGEIINSVSSSGVANPGATIPIAGEPLVTQEEYEIIIGEQITNLSRWLYTALAVSEFIEIYCNFSWRNTATVVPMGLKLIVAKMIKSQYDILLGTINPTKKSESISNYSYTLADNIKSQIVLEQYNESLNMYREIPYGFYPDALTGE